MMQLNSFADFDHISDLNLNHVHRAYYFYPKGDLYGCLGKDYKVGGEVQNIFSLAALAHPHVVTVSKGKYTVVCRAGTKGKDGVEWYSLTLLLEENKGDHNAT